MADPALRRIRGRGRAAPRVALRVDASRAIGMGHLLRMRDLAAELASRGVGRIFACRADSHAILRAQGIGADEIVTAGADAAWVAAARASHVVTDIQWSGNAFAAAHEIEVLTATGRPVSVIDSMPPDHFVTARGAVPPALVVTPYLGARDLRPPPRAGEWAAGADFAMMDASYAAARRRIAEPLPQRILVSCGGADPSGLSVRIAERLAPLGPDVDLVLGPLYPAETRQALLELVGAHPNLAVHEPQRGLADMLERCGLVVGRIGLLRYQAAMLGRHAIYLFESDDYRVYLEHFAAAGLAEVYLAEPPAGEAPFLDRLSALGDPAVRAPLFALNAAALAAVHGQGTANVVDRILAQNGNDGA